MNRLILPGNPLFDLTLTSSLPPGWVETAVKDGEQCAFVVRDSGLMEPVTSADLDEYLLGGEYQARLDAIGQFDQDDALT